MTLGQLFQKHRIDLGRSLEQISASTKIHVKILSAIEEDRYSDLPARAFTRGFIVTYAKALRLNSDEILSNYQDFLESKFAERSDRDKGHQGYVFEGKEIEQNKRGMVIGASVAATFAIATVLIFKPQNHHRNEKHKEFVEEASPSPAVETADTALPPPNLIPSDSAPIATAKSSTNTPIAPIAVATSVPASSPAAKAPSPAPTATAATPIASASPVAAVAATSPTPKPDKLNKGDELDLKEVTRKIVFQADEDVWVRYQADQKPTMMIILRKGRQLVIKAKDQIRVQTKTGASLQYRTRGSQFKPLDQNQFAVEPDGSLKAGEALSPTDVPSQVPAPAN